MAADIVGLGAAPVSYTPEMTYLRGRYRLGPELLAYYAVAMRVDEAAKVLTLPRDVVLDPLAPIRMEELFQRDLDAGHGLEIEEYLKRGKMPKFFNALTAVVLPLDPQHARRFAHKYLDLPNRPPIVDQANFDTKDIGPVRIRSLRSNSDAGMISWDSRLSKAVIVDGQHRLWAMKELLDDQGFLYRSDLADSTVPVLVVVLDKAAGFESDAQNAHSVISVCRSLFIDLNKHAKTVSFARQILLDDRDLAAVAMRDLLSEVVGGDNRSVAERVAESHQLPLALVDWSAEDPKFDLGPYVTTALVLYDLCRMAIGYVAPSATDYAAVRDYIASLIARLELDAVLEFDEKELLREIDRAEQNGLPFGLGHIAIRAVSLGFRSSLGTYIIRALTELEPYRRLIAELQAKDLLSGRHEQWMGLDRPGRSAYVEETGIDPGEIAAMAAEAVKPEFRFAYQVVYQKAFIQAMIDMDRARGVLAETWFDREEISLDEYIGAWIERFNSRLSPKLADAEQWAAAGLTVTGTISWTQASQRAIAGFTTYALIAPLEKWAALSNEDADEAARAWLVDAWSKTGSGKISASIDGLYRMGSTWRRSVTSYVRGQFKARGDETDPTEDDFVQFGVSKLLALL